FTDAPVLVKATEIRTRNYGAYEVNTTWAALDEDVSPTVYASRAAYEAAEIGPEEVDAIRSEIRTRNYGASEVNTTWAALDEDVSPTVYASRAAYEAAEIGPEEVDVI